MINEAVAVVRGETLQQLPAQVILPDEPLRIEIEEFSGPLDFLLYLVRKQRFDIRDIPVALICKQYHQYLNQMLSDNPDLSSEYLAMAATLVRIKARMLLPIPQLPADDTDPRVDLAQMLLEYEKIKFAARAVKAIPKLGDEVFAPDITVGHVKAPVSEPPQISALTLGHLMAQIMVRKSWTQEYQMNLPTVNLVQLRRDVVDYVYSYRVPMPFISLFGINQDPTIGDTFSTCLQLTFEEMLKLEQADLSEPWPVVSAATSTSAAVSVSEYESGSSI